MGALEFLGWIVALERVPGKLSGGGKVASVGCDLAAALIMAARLYPRSRFLGFAPCPGDVAWGRRLAALEGVTERVAFEQALPAEFAGTGYDLVAHVGGLRERVDTAARQVRRALAPDGTWVIGAPDGDEARLRAAVLAGGFTRFRRAAEPFVFEVRA
jgi:hypothetical protein